MSKLNEIHCIPCMSGVPQLSNPEITGLLENIYGWEVVEDHHLKKKFSFPDFQSSLNLVNQVGRLAEQEGHHPDICFGWGYVEVTIWTHKIDGLSESDFILAAKIDSL